MSKRIRKLRHWKQRFDLNAKYIWNKRVLWQGEDVVPGVEIPKDLLEDRIRLRRFWESGIISLAQFDEPDVSTGRNKEDLADDSNADNDSNQDSTEDDDAEDTNPETEDETDEETSDLEEGADSEDPAAEPELEACAETNPDEEMEDESSDESWLEDEEEK